jgi:hypothetical protein
VYQYYIYVDKKETQKITGSTYARTVGEFHISHHGSEYTTLTATGAADYRDRLPSKLRSLGFTRAKIIPDENWPYTWRITDGD